MICLNFWNCLYKLFNWLYCLSFTLNLTFSLWCLQIDFNEIVIKLILLKRVNYIYWRNWFISGLISFLNVLNNLLSIGFVLIFKLFNLSYEEFDLMFLLNDNLFFSLYFRSLLNLQESFHKVILCFFNLSFKVFNSFILDIIRNLHTCL